MPKNTVTDPITDQEIAFARLILSGTMTDRDAAQSGAHSGCPVPQRDASPGGAVKVAKKVKFYRIL